MTWKWRWRLAADPKSLHERDGAALGLVDAVIPSHAAVQTEESPDEDTQYRGHHLRVIGQTVAQGEGQRKNPLACRDMRKHAVHQVRRGIRHFLIAASYRACVRSRS